MANSEKIISESLEWAAKKYSIITSSCAYSYKNHNLVGVNAIGAVMVRFGKTPTTIPPRIIKEIPDRFPYPGWMKDCCDILGRDTYWIWKFSKGFDNGIVLKIIQEDDSETIDDVSSFGVKLRKKYENTKRHA